MNEEATRPAADAKPTVPAPVAPKISLLATLFFLGTYGSCEGALTRKATDASALRMGHLAGACVAVLLVLLFAARAHRGAKVRGASDGAIVAAMRDAWTLACAAAWAQLLGVSAELGRGAGSSPSVAVPAYAALLALLSGISLVLAASPHRVVRTLGAVVATAAGLGHLGVGRLALLAAFVLPVGAFVTLLLSMIQFLVAAALWMVALSIFAPKHEERLPLAAAMMGSALLGWAVWAFALLVLAMVPSDDGGMYGLLGLARPSPLDTVRGYNVLPIVANAAAAAILMFARKQARQAAALAPTAE